MRYYLEYSRRDMKVIGYCSMEGESTNKSLTEVSPKKFKEELAKLGIEVEVEKTIDEKVEINTLDIQDLGEMTAYALEDVQGVAEMTAYALEDISTTAELVSYSLEDSSITAEMLAYALEKIEELENKIKVLEEGVV